MRLTCLSIVLTLIVGFFADRTLAQIPERVTFQPGSFAHGYRPGVSQPITVVIETEAAEAVNVENDDAPQTEWEAAFGGKSKTEVVRGPIGVENVQHHAAPSAAPPYLAWHRCPWTGRIHLIPYQPGYADAPEQFPTKQSKLNLWLSSLPSREQNRPQQKYLSYYDPMPEVLADKPSRLQLLLGYDDPSWTASCCNSPNRAQTAHCPGVDPICPGIPAEARIADQVRFEGPVNGYGRFAGPAPFAGYHAHGYPPLGVNAFYGAAMFNHGFCPCPECQHCPAPKSPCPLPPPICTATNACHSTHCQNCALDPCAQKSFRALDKNAPKMKNCTE